ncbi:MAG TPA: hypothetical protein VK705_08320 [Ferruginibacter sp.]|jgi:hypothetical protein|nr:hypothetical protein [Ferruginibacter sp.]
MRFFSAIIFVIAIFISSSVKSQKLTNAKTYLAVIDKQHTKIAKDFLEYSNAISQRKKTDKITSLNRALLNEINKSELTISAMPLFQDDKEFRDSAVSFTKACFNLLNTDYIKIATIEPTAEKSFDKMKELLTAKVLANGKLKVINVSYHVASMKFADKYINNKDEFSDKTQQASDVNTYYNKIYLLFFKTYNSEIYLLDAIKLKDGNSVEQNKKIVYQNAQDGLKQLDTLKAFNGDNNLIKNGKLILTFYSAESDEKMGDVSGYFPAAKEFQKTRILYEKKPSHTKDEVNDYKKAVDEFNASLKKFNNTSHDLDRKRKKLFDNWNDASKDFFNKHLPNT